MLSGPAVDIYAANIYYHGHCLLYFNRQSKNDESENPMEELVRHHFISYIRVNICNDKNAYLLNDLLNDAIYMSQEHDIEAIFTNTKSLRRYLEQNFKELGFKKSGKNVIVYSLDIDSILYSESILNGHGQRKSDIIAAFAKIIHRISDEYGKQESFDWPPSCDDLISGLENDKPSRFIQHYLHDGISKMDF